MIFDDIMNKQLTHYFFWGEDTGLGLCDNAWLTGHQGFLARSYMESALALCCTCWALRNEGREALGAGFNCFGTPYRTYTGCVQVYGPRIPPEGVFDGWGQLHDALGDVHAGVKAF